MLDWIARHTVPCLSCISVPKTTLMCIFSIARVDFLFKNIDVLALFGRVSFSAQLLYLGHKKICKHCIRYLWWFCIAFKSKPSYGCTLSLWVPPYFTIWTVNFGNELKFGCFTTCLAHCGLRRPYNDTHVRSIKRKNQFIDTNFFFWFFKTNWFGMMISLWCLFFSADFFSFWKC